MKDNIYILREYIIDRNKQMRIKIGKCSLEGLKAKLLYVCKTNHINQNIIQSITIDDIILISEFSYEIRVINKVTYNERKVESDEIYFALVDYTGSFYTDTLTRQDYEEIKERYKREKINKNKDILIINNGKRLDLSRDKLKEKLYKSEKSIAKMLLNKNIEDIQRIYNEDEDNKSIIILKDSSYCLSISDKAYKNIKELFN